MSIIEGIAQKMVEEDVPKRLPRQAFGAIINIFFVSRHNDLGAQERLIRIMAEIARAKKLFYL